MDLDNLLIGLGGLILSVLTYFAGVWRTERQNEASDSEARITRVLNNYVQASQAGKRNGYHGLSHAGVGTLRNDAEIRELLDRIRKHGQPWDPRAQLEGIDTFEFFQTAIARNINFMHGGAIDALIAEFKAKGG
ncbi:MAG: hypothetical protein SF051_10840 [Elusimicrobiota bacterium]|nr:hypothetical protein [Elusimicrobiota bacterium]